MATTRPRQHHPEDHTTRQEHTTHRPQRRLEVGEGEGNPNRRPPSPSPNPMPLLVGDPPPVPRDGEKLQAEKNSAPEKNSQPKKSGVRMIAQPPIAWRVERMWPGGPLRRFSACARAAGASGVRYESKNLDSRGAPFRGVAGAYVCEQCRNSCAGVYRVGDLWLCGTCRKAAA
jgi:hypothetical protein